MRNHRTNLGMAGGVGTKLRGRCEGGEKNNDGGKGGGHRVPVVLCSLSCANAAVECVWIQPNYKRKTVLHSAMHECRR